MDIKGFLADHMGHFSPYEIPHVLFAFLFAALLAWVAAVVGAGSRGATARRLAVWAGTAALGVAFVRMQLPIAVALVAILLLVRPAAFDQRDRSLLFGALVIGLGCGSGASLIVAALFIPYLLLLRWAFAGKGPVDV